MSAAPNIGSMTANGSEVFCPECGYNLRGIPEDRCPECGFGFEHAAIRLIAAARFAKRLTTYQRTLRLALVATISCAVSNADDLGRSAHGDLLLGFFGIAFCAFELWLVLCVVYWDPLGIRFFRSLWRLGALTVLLPPGLLLGLFAPELPRALAVVILLRMAWTLMSQPSRFVLAELSLPPESRCRLLRWAAAAWLSVVAVACAIIASLT